MNSMGRGWRGGSLIPPVPPVPPCGLQTTARDPPTAGRELALFSWSIPPSFVVSPNVPMLNTRAIWLCFGAFLSPPASPFGFTGHYPLASRPTPRPALRWDQRDQVVRGPSPAGYCLTPTVELAKTERGPTSTTGPSIFSMSPNQAISAEKSIRFSPNRRRPTVDHSLAVGGVQGERKRDVTDIDRS